MLSCPNCGSDNSERYRSPKDIQDVRIRRKKCAECGHIFATAEVVITPGLAGRLEGALSQGAFVGHGSKSPVVQP